MKVLVVGGTADGRKLASRLYALNIEVVYSIAGLVRKATVPCPVVSGGFTQFGGLQKYIIEHQITHLVDVTHPFAQTMSNKIAEVSGYLSIPAIRFHRKQWVKTSLDKWVEVNDWPELIEKVRSNMPINPRLFVTAGQVSQSVIDTLATQAEQLLIRTAMPAKVELPSNVIWIKAIGPFQLEEEKRLIKQYKIDAIISKNSGGDSTYAKIKAAAEAGICVYQFKRPMLQPLRYQCDNEGDCIKQLTAFLTPITETTHTEFKDEI